jgi:hypothetical protein
MAHLRTFSLALAVVVITNYQTPAQAVDPIDELLSKIPEQANALVAIDLKGLQASPLAQREGWAKKNQLDILGGSLPTWSPARCVARGLWDCCKAISN